MKKQFVDKYRWIDEKEMLELIAIAQSSPGAIAVNGAIVMGYKLARLIGVFVAVVATVLPPFLIITLISLCYEAFKDNIWISLMLDGMQAGVGAIIASIVYEMGLGIVKEKRIDHIVIMCVAFFGHYFLNINVVYIIVTCGFIGILQTYYRKWRQVK